MFLEGGEWDGELKIHGKYRKKVSVVEPHWITLEHPNVTKTDSLLVVIKGVHTGRFARRICHGFTDQTFTTKNALVALMNRQQGQPDSIDVELHFNAEDLAIVEESASDKNFHSACVISRRDEARPGH